MQPHSTFKWSIGEGDTIIFPGDVPRYSSINDCDGALVLLSFDVTTAPQERGTRNTPPLRDHQPDDACTERSADNSHSGERRRVCLRT